MRLLFLLLVLLIGGGASSVAQSADCIASTLEGYYADVPVVFEGRVLGLNQAASDDNPTMSLTMVEVEWRYKGTLPWVTVIHSGYPFEVGEEYLIFARWV